MKTTRRGFFGMVSGAIAAALTPKPLLALAIPDAAAKIAPQTSYNTYLVGKDALIHSSYTVEQRCNLRFLGVYLQSPEAEKALNGKGYRVDQHAVARFLREVA